LERFKVTTYKMVEVVGTSNTSVTDAIRGAVHRAGQTLQDLQWFEVKELRGRLNGTDVLEYQVKVEIGFLLHAPEQRTGDTARTNQTTGPTPEARSERAQIARKRGTREDTERGTRET
jgi:dodecin